MLEYFIYHYGTQIIAAILCAIFGCLGYAIKQLATKYVNDDTKRSIAREAMLFVEQVWKTIHGADKLSKALEVAEALLKKKGIDFDAEEMQILIHADDFLHNMARIIVGTLMDIGLGNRSVQDIDDIFAGILEASAPCDPKGLYLQEVTY